MLAGALPAMAAELPTHKAGLWEVKMTLDKAGQAGQTFSSAWTPRPTR
jgi:hypothetical protein